MSISLGNWRQSMGLLIGASDVRVMMPALPCEVSSPGRRRSISVTDIPRRCNSSARRNTDHSRPADPIFFGTSLAPSLACHARARHALVFVFPDNIACRQCLPVENTLMKERHPCFQSLTKIKKSVGQLKASNKIQIVFTLRPDLSPLPASPTINEAAELLHEPPPPELP